MNGSGPAIVIALVLGGVACGGSATGPSGTPAPVPVTETFAGTTTQDVNTCSGDSHTFTAAVGEIAVTLIETSDPAGALSVQVCGTVDAGNCSIKQQKITVGQTISGARAGTSTQVLKFLGYSCAFGGTPAKDPISYRAGVTYRR